MSNNSMDLETTMILNSSTHPHYLMYLEPYVHDHWKVQPDMSQTAHNLFGIVGVAIFTLSLAGNFSVIFLFARFRSLRSFSNLFVLNLTVADFILCIGNIPMFITSCFWGHWVFGNIGCQIYAFIGAVSSFASIDTLALIAIDIHVCLVIVKSLCTQNRCQIYAFIGAVSSFASINTLALIAIDRCLVIVKSLPTQNRMSARTFIMCISSIWTYSVLWGSTPFLGFGEYILEGTNTSCTFDFLTRTYNIRLYVISIFTAHFVIPVFLIICSYCMIFKSIAHHKQEFAIAKKIYGEEEVPIRMRKNNTGMAYESRAARASIIVIAIFCVSWTPYATVSLIGMFGNVNLVTRLGSGIPCLLAKFSTVMNPIIYALLHPKFRMKLVRLGICSERYQDRMSLFRRSVVYFRSQRSDRISRTGSKRRAVSV